MRHNLELLLFNLHNDHYRDAIEKSGIAFSDYQIPANPEPERRVSKKNDTRISILEVDPGNCLDSAGVIESLPATGVKICITPSISDSMKTFLLECGIADLLLSPKPRRLIHIIRSLSPENAQKTGEIMILDGEKKHRSILSSIITRFGFAPLFAEDTKAVLQYENVQTLAFIAINLGEPGLDLRGLVRGFLSSTALKRIPLLAYHDSTRGIYIHELLGGLNRITSYILSTEEIYSFLVDMLYRKEITPLIEKLHAQLNSPDVDFGGETLSRIYHDHRDRLFTMKNIYDEDTSASCENLIDSMKLSMLKVDGLRWLTAKGGTVKTITCGAGVLI